VSLSLLDARIKLASILAPVENSDPAVLVSLVDSIQPPALMIGWGEPWLDSLTTCKARGRLVITCVASRLVPGEGIAILENLVAYALDRIAGDSIDLWAVDNVTGPRVFSFAKTVYLACRITLTVTIDG
jgi:hypothetical protein